MFSPHYAARRRGGRLADPLDHAAVNVVLSGPGGRWAMTERGRGAVVRERARLGIGPSALAWDGNGLALSVDERAAPVPRAVRGTIRVHPRALTAHAETIDGAGRHRWRPIAPSCRVEVALDAPSLRWSGTGYLDSNDGDAPLEADFRRWDWSRVADGAGRVSVFYDTFGRDGAGRAIALSLGADGGLAPIGRAPPRQRLAPTLWGVPRWTRGDDGTARVRRTPLDAPFYNRSEIETVLDGVPVRGIGESLDLDRFRRPAVQAMLRFRVPRGGARRPAAATG